MFSRNDMRSDIDTKGKKGVKDEIDSSNNPSLESGFDRFIPTSESEIERSDNLIEKVDLHCIASNNKTESNDISNNEIYNTASNQFSSQEGEFIKGLREFTEYSRVTLNQKLKKMSQ